MKTATILIVLVGTSACGTREWTAPGACDEMVEAECRRAFECFGAEERGVLGIPDSVEACIAARASALQCGSAEWSDVCLPGEQPDHDAVGACLAAIPTASCDGWGEWALGVPGCADVCVGDGAAGDDTPGDDDSDGSGTGGTLRLSWRILVGGATSSCEEIGAGDVALLVHEASGNAWSQLVDCRFGELDLSLAYGRYVIDLELLDDGYGYTLARDSVVIDVDRPVVLAAADFVR